jgi:hypothetical protein
MRLIPFDKPFKRFKLIAMNQKQGASVCQASEKHGRMIDPTLTKFYPTKAWRKRQKLGTLLNCLSDTVDCLELSFANKQFDRGNFEFSLMQAQCDLAKLNEYFFRHK